MYQLEDLISDLAAAARRFSDNGMQLSNGGNLSARVPGENLMLIKGTDVAFSQVSARTLVIADFDGNLVKGEMKPSKESLLHGALYRKMPEVQAIMHCHSPWANSWGATGLSLPPATYHSTLKLGDCVPVFDTNSYAVPAECFPPILAHFSQHPSSRAFILARHGQVALGRTVQEAAFLAELVEETAQIAVLSKIACLE